MIADMSKLNNTLEIVNPCSNSKFTDEGIISSIDALKLHESLTNVILEDFRYLVLQMLELLYQC